MVSIITVNFNGWQDTCELITSFKQFETYPYQLIVVDNNSNGNDVYRIRTAHPDVLVVASASNRGFAGGNNLGYQHAKGDYIFYLNNDMVIKSAILLPLVQRLQSGQFAGVSPSIMFLYKPQYVQYYGYRDLSSITLKHTTPGFDPLQREAFLQPHQTEVLHGGAMMVRRDVIEKVGTMTEAYFLFYEEFDWSRCMRQAGYLLYYEASAEVYHKESMTIKPLTPLREFYLTRSRMIYARRNRRGVVKLLACAYQLLMAMPKKSVRYLLKGELLLAKAVWRGVFLGLVASIDATR